MHSNEGASSQSHRWLRLGTRPAAGPLFVPGLPWLLMCRRRRRLQLISFSAGFSFRHCGGAGPLLTEGKEWLVKVRAFALISVHR